MKQSRPIGFKLACTHDNYCLVDKSLYGRTVHHRIIDEVINHLVSDQPSESYLPRSAGPQKWLESSPASVRIAVRQIGDWMIRHLLINHIVT